MSAQRPLYRAWKQDPERVEKWKREEYPAIKARAAEVGARILFADEASVRTDYHAGTTWAPVGQTPVVTGSAVRHAVKMISAVGQRGELSFQVHEGSMNAERFTWVPRRSAPRFRHSCFPGSRWLLGTQGAHRHRLRGQHTGQIRAVLSSALFSRAEPG